MNEALLIGGLHQHELRELAEGLNEQLRKEIAQRKETEKQLRLSATRFRRLFEAAQDGILIVDPFTLKIADANPFICALLDYTRDELVGKELWTIGRVEDQERSQNTFRKLHQRGIARYADLPLLSKTGVVVPVEIVSNVYEEDGREVIQCNIRDITERTNTAEGLRASDERYRALYDALPVAAFVCDLNAVIQNYNQRAVELWGREPVIGLEQHWGSLKLWLPDGSYLPRARSPMMEVLRTGKARRNVEVLIERPDGSRLPVTANFCALADGQGNVIGVVTSFDDITERKRAAEDLATLARRTQLLSETAAQLLKFETALESLAPIFVRFAQEVGAEYFFHHVALGDGTLGLMSQGGLSSRQCDVLQVIPIGKDLCGRAALRMAPVIVNEIQRSGEEKAVLLRGLGARAYASYPLKIGQRLFGTFSFVSLFRDRFSPQDLAMISTLCDLVSAATDRKRLLFEASAARGTAEKANAAKDDFLATLSHELRTPLNPVLLLATASADDPRVPAELRADFEVIARNVLLEARLIDDLLDSTRISRGKLILERMPLFVNEIVKDAIANVQSEFEGKHLTLMIELDPANPTVNGDAMRLQQIVWNVLKNALKFTPGDGRVSIQTTSDDARGCVRIEIGDTGEGMTPAELARIFDAFEQGDHAGRSSSKKLGGLGLGLAIARSLAELHSGSIRATSDGIGRGSQFIIELPLHTAETGTGVGSSPVIGHADTATMAARCSGLRILLVEDHAPTRTALGHLLTKRKHVVSTAATVAEARELGNTETFDLLITDIGLPDGSGYDLMAELGLLKKLKGIAMTGYGMEEDIERSAQVGFSAHLTKPVKMQALENAISAATKAADRG